MPGNKSVVVTVDDASLKDIHTVANRLVAHGMTIDRVMPLTGVITGTYARGKMSLLKTVSGVNSVEEELGVQLPPSDSPVQ